MQERVAVFIDGSNLYHALQSNFGRHDLNFTAFAAKLCKTRRLFRIYYYNVLQDQTQRPDGYREQQEFLDVLRRTPNLEVRLGSSKVAQGVTIEKGIDVMIATDLLYFAWNNSYDAAILVSGDADFAYALQTVKNMGKYVEVAYFENSISKELLYLTDNSHLLDRKFFSDLWVSRRRGSERRRRGINEVPRPNMAQRIIHHPIKIQENISVQPPQQSDSFIPPPELPPGPPFTSA